MNIYGASGHAKVIYDIAVSCGLEINEIYDDNPEITHLFDFTVINKITNRFLESETVIAIGNNKIRKKIALAFGGKFHPALVHPTATLSPSALNGEGTVVMANATINSEAQVGMHCIINTGAIVEHDCIIDDFVHISPNAAIAGEVRVGKGSHIGIGAVVIPGIKIGRWCTVGAGAVIIKDVPDYAVIVGNPGRIIRIIKE
ncbi:acetyltransferase [soil metagenome]